MAQGIDFIIDKTWNNKPVDHEPVRVHMEWKFEKQVGQPHKRVVKTQIRAPMFDDDPPPNDFPGYCADLYNYECVELFFANEKGHYLEVEVGPHGNWLVLLFDKYRHGINTGEDIELDMEIVIDGDNWICNVEIPLAFFPANITKFNAYAIHGMGDNRQYEALSPVTDGSLAKPDFHRTEYFTTIDSRRIIPQGYNGSTFNDLKLGNVWEECLRDSEE